MNLRVGSILLAGTFALACGKPTAVPSDVPTEVPGGPDTSNLDCDYSAESVTALAEGLEAEKSEDYVIDKFTLFDSTSKFSGEAGHYKGEGCYTYDGAPDNQFGAVIAAVSQVFGDFQIQGWLDRAVNSGQALNLIRYRPVSVPAVAGSPAAIQIWPALSTSCCTDPLDWQQCATQAQVNCFGGGRAFDANGAVPSLAVPVSVETGKILAGPYNTWLNFAFSPSKTLLVAMRQTRIEATINGDGSMEGVLWGVFTHSDMEKKILPAFALAVDASVRDPDISLKTKDTMLDLFDEDFDGSISEAEFVANEVVKVLVGGDVALDVVGQKGISFGLRFHAVKAKIN
jgi:hypothetical protein